MCDKHSRVKTLFSLPSSFIIILFLEVETSRSRSGSLLLSAIAHHIVRLHVCDRPCLNPLLDVGPLEDAVDVC